jgi:predicted SprT family Zn-dependent metalloprotease
MTIRMELPNNARTVARYLNCTYRFVRGIELMAELFKRRLIDKHGIERSILHVQYLENHLFATSVNVSNKIKTTAGIAYSAKNEIVLHPACLDQEDPIFLNGDGVDTFLHEMAHIAADFIFKKNCKHDVEWGTCAFCFGIDPTKYTTHDYKSYKQRKENREIDEITKLLGGFKID